MARRPRRTTVAGCRRWRAGVQRARQTARSSSSQGSCHEGLLGTQARSLALTFSRVPWHLQRQDQGQQLQRSSSRVRLSHPWLVATERARRRALPAGGLAEIRRCLPGRRTGQSGGRILYFCVLCERQSTAGRATGQRSPWEVTGAAGSGTKTKNVATAGCPRGGGERRR